MIGADFGQSRPRPAAGKSPEDRIEPDRDLRCFPSGSVRAHRGAPPMNPATQTDSDPSASVPPRRPGRGEPGRGRCRSHHGQATRHQPATATQPRPCHTCTRVSRRGGSSARARTGMLGPEACSRYERQWARAHQCHSELCLTSTTRAGWRSGHLHSTAPEIRREPPGPGECDHARDPSVRPITPRCRARVGRNRPADTGGGRRSRSRRARVVGRRDRSSSSLFAPLWRVRMAPHQHACRTKGAGSVSLALGLGSSLPTSCTSRSSSTASTS